MRWKGVRRFNQVVRAAALLWLWVPTAAATALTLDLEAKPDRIPADGQSTSQLVASVRDDHGNYVGDVQRVIFRTTQGTLSQPGGNEGTPQLEVETRNGVAEAQLRSVTEEVAAEVTAVLLGREDVVDLVRVSFGSGSAPQTPGSRLIHIDGDFVAYSSEVSLVEAMSQARLTHQGLEVESPRLWFDLSRQEVIAKGYGGGVRIASGGTEYVGDALKVNLRSLQGVIYSAQAGRAIYFQGQALKPYEGEGARTLTQGLFDPPATLNDVRTWIRARSIVIYPQEKIQFEQARFYVEGAHFLSLPYHFEPLSGYGMSTSQMVSYSSYYGVVVNVPYYLRASERDTAALRLQRGAPMGYFTRNKGWGLQLEEQYATPDRQGEGVFYVDRLTSRRFGLRLEHRQKWGQQGVGYFSLDYPEHRDLLFNSSVNLRQPGGDLWMRMSASRYAGFGSRIYSQTVWRLRPREIKGWNSFYGLSLSLDYSRSRYRPDTFQPGLSVDLNPRIVPLDAQTSLSMRLGGQYSWSTRRERNGRLQASVSVQRRLGRTGSATVGYNYYLNRSTVFQTPPRHTLSVNAYANEPGRWYGYLYSSYELKQGDFYTSGTVNVQVSPLWRVDVRALYQDYAFWNFFDTELALEREVLGREVRLVWSKARRKFFVELGEISF